MSEGCDIGPEVLRLAYLNEARDGIAREYCNMIENLLTQREELIAANARLQKDSDNATDALNVLRGAVDEWLACLDDGAVVLPRRAADALDRLRRLRSAGS